MKVNKFENPGRKRGILFTLGTVLAIAVLIALFIGAFKLRELWLEQCVITDPARQIEITSGKMVKADVIAENFGLRKGANLATIDFKKKREEILEKIPNIRELTIARHLPDRVTISVEERTPIVRLNIRGRRADTGKVADNEGVVFLCSRGTQTLPIIREPQAPGTSAGSKLDGRAKAALNLLETCQDGKFRDFKVQEADISKPDYIILTLGNYQQVKICWEGMDEPSAVSQDKLIVKLNQLHDVIRSNLAGGAMVWDATQPNQIIPNTRKVNP